MAKLKNVNELKNLLELLSNEIDESKPSIVICAGTACQASSSNDIIQVAKKYILEKDLTKLINIKVTGCHGFCEMGPFILSEPQGAFYHKVTIKTVNRIIDAVISNSYAEDLLYTDPKTNIKYYKQCDIPFFKNQKRIIFEKNQQLDPTRVFDYMSKEGYRAFEKVISNYPPEKVIEEVKNSGLRGRGGAGFPTGLKWEMLSKRKEETKYIVCNADEGDPGAYMDRSLLEGNPHSIIEGMLIGAYATGSSEGIVYVRNEYPLAIKHLIIALQQAREIGLLGTNILQTNFSFDIKIVKGAGAFVCGEETALIRSIEGKVGEPRQRPPFPIEKGINNKPTSINNVETWANIPFIINLGSSEYAKIGTKGNNGTKIFSLVGKIKNTGLIEVPMGITIKDIIYNIGGGSSGKAKIKAVQTGGPSGGCIPASKFDLTIDYDTLSKAGSIMGSGGMIVMDESTCMVDVAKYFMNFLKDESCGKCFSCRKGTQRMYEILDDISNGKATLDQLDLLEELAYVVKDTTMCGLGQTASNPVLSTLKFFRHEYIEHIVDHKCSAGVCKNLVGAPCQNSCPLGTEVWKYVANISRREYKEAYMVIREANPFPSVCARVCTHPCEDRCRSGSTGGKPIAIRTLKRFITDNVDPSIYKPKKIENKDNNKIEIAVIGSGPAGLTAAHYLSLKDYRVTIFEKESIPGGMLNLCIPEYRMPKDVLNKEIESLMNENITIKYNTFLGKDLTIDGLFEKGFKAVFLTMGAHKSRLLNIDGENCEGVYQALDFLKSYNVYKKELAKGHVGVIGGGDSAIDSARVALRQKNVSKVTIFYRRTFSEMPAIEDDIKGAIEEGIEIKTLVSPICIHSKENKLAGVDFISNTQGDIDSSGRREPIPNLDSKEFIPLDTLIASIGDMPDIEFIEHMGVEINKKSKTLLLKDIDLTTTKKGVFAGGDAATGPSTVIEAIAAGKKGAQIIDLYLQGKELKLPNKVSIPDVYIESLVLNEDLSKFQRVNQPFIPVEKRKNNFKEIELTISEAEAVLEAKRCMRCDLEFTQPTEMKDQLKVKEKKQNQRQK
ncbi:MAG: FAD-dependent oxidoreductase [Spirochaetes bacterium]|nr:FAD-dependent oxidoreductase [Spirochaetota bacterium]